MLEAHSAAGVQKFLTSVLGFMLVPALWGTTGTHGCSHHPAAASWECTCQLVHGRDLDCFLLTSRSLHIQISLLPHWQVVERASYDGSAVFSSLPGRHGDGNCFVGLDEDMNGGWREDWTHCEDHKLSSFWLCSSNNFINIASAISTV